MIVTLSFVLLSGINRIFKSTVLRDGSFCRSRIPISSQFSDVRSHFQNAEQLIVASSFFQQKPSASLHRFRASIPSSTVSLIFLMKASMNRGRSLIRLRDKGFHDEGPPPNVSKVRRGSVSLVERFRVQLWFARADLDMDWQPTTGAVLKVSLSTYNQS